MSLSELVVPVLLCFTACYALGKRVDVYTALTRGAEEGLNVLVHILPSLIALLTAVYMFRASGAMEYLGALLAPALERVGIPPEVAPLLFIRPISGSGALAVGSDVITAYYRMESLELWAKITINAVILGGSIDISRKNIDKLIDLRSFYRITGRHPGYQVYNPGDPLLHKKED